MEHTKTIPRGTFNTLGINSDFILTVLKLNLNSNFVSRVESVVEVPKRVASQDCNITIKYNHSKPHLFSIWSILGILNWILKKMEPLAKPYSMLRNAPTTVVEKTTHY